MYDQQRRFVCGARRLTPLRVLPSSRHRPQSKQANKCRPTVCPCAITPRSTTAAPGARRRHRCRRCLPPPADVVQMTRSTVAGSWASSSPRKKTMWKSSALRPRPFARRTRPTSFALAPYPSPLSPACATTRRHRAMNSPCERSFFASFVRQAQMRKLASVAPASRWSTDGRSANCALYL